MSFKTNVYTCRQKKMNGNFKDTMSVVVVLKRNVWFFHTITDQAVHIQRCLSSTFKFLACVKTPTAFCYFTVLHRHSPTRFPSSVEYYHYIPIRPTLPSTPPPFPPPVCHRRCKLVSKPFVHASKFSNCAFVSVTTRFAHVIAI